MADMHRQLLNEINLVGRVKAQTPTRIVVTDRVPRGAIFSAPIEGKPTLSIRHSKSGPYEVLVHPDDWREITKAVVPFDPESDRLPVPTTAWGIPIHYGTPLGDCLDPEPL